ncbi:hypothetical protein CSB45_01815 [candidate division KSB3 bacterium]|uniref:Uncharacterized protein n=1 Tax=candidate division KSB3 bacterium TaxID=2044937 RepID=A0A2G6EBD4_9BACT|nr:MAG: hypothetical protein CSB45_01815 [candidate division KSB3 bacterium]
MNMLHHSSIKDNNFFLIPHRCPLDKIADRVTKSRYRALGKTFCSSRFRGTSIAKHEGAYQIIAWQRNVARLQKMDVSLPTIVSLNLDQQRIIQDIALDPSFAGSQGLSCSQSYLQRMLTKHLEGRPFTLAHIDIMSIKFLHCLHLQEVLQGALAFLEQHETSVCYNVDEIETGEAIDEGSDIRIVDVYEDSNGTSLSWELTLLDYKDRLCFGKNGEIRRIDHLDIVFSSSSSKGEDIHLQTTIHGDTPERIIAALLRFTLKCWKGLACQIQTKQKTFYNTNAFPISLIGLIVQSLGIVIFSNNYNYFQHILAALQREQGIPLCIGIVEHIEEAQTYFPEFSLEDVYS